MKDLAGRYEFVNRPFEQFFGVSSGAIIGRTDQQFMSPEIAAMFRDKEFEVVKRQVGIASDDVFARPDGSTGYLRSVRFPLVGEDGLVYGVCTQSNDLTAQRVAEGELKLMQASLEADQDEPGAER